MNFRRHAKDLRRAGSAAILGLCLSLAHALAWGQTTLVMASTTSTEQSGLFGHLLPAFKAATGVDVKVVALGTGQALDMGRRGDADVLFVHDPVAEEKLVADGFGLQRWPVMYNDFVLIGPSADPAQVRGKDIALALKKSPKPMPPLSHGATKAAPMRPSCVTGRWRAPQAPVRATKPVVAAWARP